MADDKEKKDEEKKDEQEPKGEQESKAGDKTSTGFGLFTWLILGAIVIAGLAGGFALAQLLAGTDQSSPQQPEAKENQADNSPENETINDMLVDKPKGGTLWPYDLEPVIANLDEPGVTRYARVTITLQLNPQMDQEKGTAFLEGKKLILRDWLTTYIAGLSLERVRGTRNLSRIKKEVRDSFNELLFSEGKPFINDILFKEFAIQ
jgi:flagellar basal body-associated protein FliL